MLPIHNWVPMVWPSEWQDPTLLGLMSGTPVNCIVIAWPGSAASTALVGKAREAGIAVVGLLSSQPDVAAVAAGEASGLAAFASPAPVESKLPVVPWQERSALPWDGESRVLAVSDGVWPGVRTGQGEQAGPTGLPWIDSNGWWLRLSRARAPEKTFWIIAEPPTAAAFIGPRHYALAIADACAHGGRAVLTLDPKFSAALATRAETALASWKSITGVLGFFTSHEEPRRLEAIGVMGVVSSFSGDDEFFAGEILNLLARRGVPYRVYLKDRASTAPLHDLRGIIYADQSPPETALARRLQTFVQAGGLLVTGARWPKPAGPAGADTYRRFDVYKIGKGRLAVSREDAADPYLVAADAQLLLSFRNAPLRLFNTGTLSTFYTGTPDGRRALLHVVNYSMRTFGHPVSAVLRSKFRRARMRSPGLPVTNLDLVPTREGGVEIHLPPFEVYAAIELEA